MVKFKYSKWGVKVKKYISIISKTLKVIIVMFLLYFANGVTGHEETKVINNNLNKTLDLNAMAEVMEAINYNDLYSPLNTYVGDLTGYGANCPLCSGFLGCNSKDVRDGTTIYNDRDYGQVRIVASSKNIPCGSIIRFESDRISKEPTFAIVLDRGVGGTSIDLLTKSEDYARNNVGRFQIKYDLLRKGWEKRSDL